jgi:hypothetical protein
MDSLTIRLRLKEDCRVVREMPLLTTLTAAIIKSNNKDASSFLSMDLRKSYRVRDFQPFHLDKLLQLLRTSSSKYL